MNTDHRLDATGAKMSREGARTSSTPTVVEDARQTRARPLIVRFGAMGDMVMIVSMVRALAARCGAPVDILSSGSWTRPLLAGQPGVGTIYQLENRKLPFLFSAEKRALVRALRQRGPGPVWYCDSDERSLGLLQRAGLGMEMICRARDFPRVRDEHLVDYWQRFAHATPPAGGPTGHMAGGDPELEVAPSEAEELDRWLRSQGLVQKQLFLIQPGNKRTMRRGLRRRPSNTKWWPEPRWAAVIQALARMHPQAAILMLGVPREHDLNQQIIALSGVDGVFNLARELPIPRLLALQSRASAMISVDTGPAHSAAAVGCPVLVLFGVADPVRNLPRGGDTPVRHLVGQGSGGPSMLGITVEQVLTQWQGLPKR
jgi:ADP-heptose:LPS heptosyltransferase